MRRRGLVQCLGRAWFERCTTNDLAAKGSPWHVLQRCYFYVQPGSGRVLPELRVARPVTTGKADARATTVHMVHGGEFKSGCGRG